MDNETWCEFLYKLQLKWFDKDLRVSLLMMTMANGAISMLDLAEECCNDCWIDSSSLCYENIQVQQPEMNWKNQIETIQRLNKRFLLMDACRQVHHRAPTSKPVKDLPIKLTSTLDCCYL